MNTQYKNFLRSRLFQLTLIVSIFGVGCVPKSKVIVTLKKNKIIESLNISVSHVQVINHQIIITGTNLDTVKNFQIKEGFIDTNLQIESKNNTSIVANSISNVTFAAGRIFDFVLSNANGASTFTVDFSLCDSKLGGKGFNCLIAPTDKQVLSYDIGTGKWRPRSVNGLSYQGVWSGLPALPASGVLVPGDYYIISVANGVYNVGDWIVLNQDGVTFEQVENSTAVLSVFGRNGNVISSENDYILDQMGDVDLSTPPASGDALIFDGSHWVAGAVGGGGVPSGAAGGDLAGAYPNPTIGNNRITDAHIANAAISQTKINGLATSFSGKEPAITGAAITTYFRGDKTFVTLDTSVVPEGSRLYFTNARALGILLAGFDNTLTGQVSAADSMLQGFGRLQNQINSLNSGGSNYLVKNGSDTISGTVTLTNVLTASGAGDIVVPSVPLTMTSAVNKIYADGKLDKILGGTVTGIVTLDDDLKIKSGSNYVTIRGNAVTTADYNFVLPANAGAAGYFLSTDGSGNTSWASSGMPENSQAIHRARVATTTNITLSGIQTIDGVFLVADDRVLVKSQLNDEENGMYVVAAGAWSRAVDLNTWSEAIGYQVNISEGNSWDGMNFVSGAIASGILELTGFTWSPIGNTLNTENTSNGFQALDSNISGYQNIATGHYALISNTTGYRNAASGYGTLMANSTGSHNTASGYQALRNNTTGTNNTASGSSSLSNNTDGANNTASGVQALYSNTSGSENSAAGTYSLFGNTIGNYNSGIGVGVLRTNVGKNYSTAIGYNSMYYAHNTATNSDAYNTALGAFSLRGSSTASSNSGIQNTAIGASALRAVTIGSSNIGLGYNSGSAITSGSSNVIIGSNTGSTIATSSSNILLSDGAGTERARFNSSGYFGINQTVPGAELDVKGILRLSGSTSGYVGFSPAAAAGSTIYTLPSADGLLGQILRTNGAGILSWVNDNSGTGAFSGAVSRAVATDGAGALTTVATTVTELGYVAGVTGSIQTQLDAKEPAIAAGSTAQYLRGDKTLGTFSTDVKASTLTGLSSTAGNIAATDSVLQAFGKMLNTQSDYVSKSGDNTVTGSFNITGITAFLNIPTPTGTTLSEATNVDYVKTYVGANGQWTKGSGGNAADIYFNTGNVGVGTTIPQSKLDVNGSVRLGVDTTACSGTIAGAIRFDSTTKLFETCDGTNWSSSGSGTPIPASTTVIMESCAAGWTDTGVTGGGQGSVTCNGVTCRLCQSPASASAIPASSVVILEACPSSWTTLGVTSGNPIAGRSGVLYQSCQAPAEASILPQNSRILMTACPSTWTDIGATGPGQLIANCGAAACRVCEPPSGTIGSTSIRLVEGGAGGTIRDGGNVLLRGGAGGSISGSGGAASVLGGTPIDGIGGSVSIAAGNSVTSTATSRAGGIISLTAGSGVSGGTGGSITLTSGATDTGTAGYILLNPLSTNFIGIGTSTPTSRLEIADTTTSVKLSLNNKRGIADESSGILFKKNDVSQWRIVNDEGQAGVQSFEIRDEEANLARLFINSSGNVGIGSTNPGYKLQVGIAADGSEARANAWNVLSDERLKRDFEIIPESLEKILSLNGYYYYWNRGTDTSKKMGLKAQEVEKIFPEVISYGTDGFLSVSYNHLVAGLIEAVKEFYHEWLGDSKTIHKELALNGRLIASYKAENDAKTSQFKSENAAKDKEIAKLKKENAEIKERLSKLEKFLLE